MAPTVANVTLKDCESYRRACPGSRSLSMRVLVGAIVLILSMVITSHLLLRDSLADTREAAAGAAAELRIRSARQERQETQLDEVLKSLAKIEARLDANAHKEKSP
jgi:hypothetical protein